MTMFEMKDLQRIHPRHHHLHHQIIVRDKRAQELGPRLLGNVGFQRADELTLNTTFIPPSSVRRCSVHLAIKWCAK